MTHEPPLMRVHATYPPNTPQSFWRRNRHALWRSAFVLAGYLCLIINLLTGGQAWSLIVIGGLMTFWVAFIYQPQVEATPIKKLCDTALAVCLYLLLLDSVLGGGWSGFVVPIVCFGELIVTGGYFLLFFHKRKRDFLPLFELILIGLVGTLLALAGLKRLDWPMIVVGGVSVGLLLLSFLLFRKPLWLEIRKKFHT